MSLVSRRQAQQLQSEGKAQIMTSEGGKEYILGRTGSRRYLSDYYKPKRNWTPRRGSYFRFVENQK